MSQSNNVNPDTLELKDICDIYDMDCIIKEPTKVTNVTSTLIDVILTTIPQHFLTSGTIDTHISDHYLIFSVMKAKLPRPKPKVIKYRSYKYFNGEEFNADLRAIPFHIATVFDDPDDVNWAWNKLLTDSSERHVPLILCTIIRGNQVPFMTKVLLKSIMTRNRLHKKFLKSKSSEDWEKYLNLSTTKATGMDKISAKILQVAAPVIAPSLTEIFNMSIDSEQFPSDWKAARVIPLFKKGQRSMLDNYRPISILPV
ncbi:Hypothetical predicted protein, partial [Paramuricea clavata]